MPKIYIQHIRNILPNFFNRLSTTAAGDQGPRRGQSVGPVYNDGAIYRTSAHESVVFRKLRLMSLLMTQGTTHPVMTIGSVFEICSY